MVAPSQKGERVAFGVVASQGTASLVPGGGFDRRLARCASGGALVGLFFSDQLDQIARAKAICQECPVIEPCLDGALERREPWGVWGGELFAGGAVLAFKRRRGRPRKDEVVVVAQPA